ncbi:unnamed protein product, partial [Mesorhabditis belari]|uniref:GST N-terminal domain-containing protein n=1 Tax=Mesorhabditis belari TaxID=2138241 RepID=A0AAF3EXU8_9BILA
MGLLVEGRWTDDKDAPKGIKMTPFNNWVTVDGQPGPTGEGGFVAEKDRYHLYVSYGCPYAHRTLILLKLKGLEDLLSVSVVSPMMLENGWTFDETYPDATVDHLYGFQFLYQVYLKSDPKCTTRVSVPVLWDKKQHKLVSTESADIIRMLNSAFDGLGANTGDFYPKELHTKIDEVNEWVNDTVVTGSKKRILDYPNLHGYLRDIYQHPGIAETTNFNHIKALYFRCGKTLNPSGIVPIGPDMRLDVPHGRNK